jgi:parallel beta-helix repeat protein
MLVCDKMKLTKLQIIIISTAALAVILTLSLTLTLIPSKTEYTEHSGIAIWNDSDFEDYDFPGIGTAADPYLIQNYDISSPSTEGIIISGTTKHFIISNCLLKGHGNGIIISNVADGTCKIMNNDIWNSMYYGIQISYTSGFLISGNSISHNDRGGLFIQHSSFADIIGNRVHYNDEAGILLDIVNDISIKENIVTVNIGSGISISRCINAVISENDVGNTGWSGIVLWADDGPGPDIGNTNITISNNKCFANPWTGIHITETENITVKSNICYANNYTGIYSSKTENITVKSNICYDNLLGIRANPDSLNITIHGNELRNNEKGMYIESFNTVIYKNEFSNNVKGLIIWSDYNLITHNLIQNSEDYGIIILADYCIIHSNVFLDDNITNESQALSTQQWNLWYDETNCRGNFWSDWVSGEYIIDGSYGNTDPYPLYEIRL